VSFFRRGGGTNIRGAYSFLKFEGVTNAGVATGKRKGAEAANGDPCRVLQKKTAAETLHASTTGDIVEQIF
jgi:hypothetical protein